MIIPVITDRYRDYMYTDRNLNQDLGSDLDLYCSAGDELTSMGGHAWRSVGRHYALHFFAAGKGVIDADGVLYDIHKGDLFCFFPGTDYDRHDIPDAPWRYQRISLDGSRCEALLAEVGITREQPLHHGDFDRVLLPCFEELRQLFAMPAVSMVAACRLGWTCMDALHSANRPDTPSSLLPPEDVAYQMITQEFVKPLTIQHLADALGLSRTRLYLRFLEKYGVPPKAYLEHVRLEHACALLGTSTKRIGEVGFCCGFRTAQYFNQAFRRRFGISPSAWRRQSKGESRNAG